MKKKAILIVSLLLILASTVGAQGKGETLILEVEGMWGRVCEQYLEETLLADVRGVESVKGDAEAGIVEIHFDPEVTTPDDLAREVESCHYLDVTGSTTHDLTEIDEPRRAKSCCSGSSCPIV